MAQTETTKKMTGDTGKNGPVDCLVVLDEKGKPKFVFLTNEDRDCGLHNAGIEPEDYKARGWTTVVGSVSFACPWDPHPVRDPRYTPSRGDFLAKGDVEREVVRFDGVNVSYLAWRASRGNRASGMLGQGCTCKIGTWLNWAGKAKVGI